jgi:hypothetical protein
LHRITSLLRDAWNERKGVSEEEAWAKYVEKLLAVCCSCVLIRCHRADLITNTPRQILEAAGTDEAKGYIEEIKAAAA